MKAGEGRVEGFLSSTKTQFVIPVYQRSYDWTISQCNQLLDDIVKAGSNYEIKAHFIGSIVFIHDDVYTTTGVKELVIIDGQQRLTTLTIIYIVLYNIFKEMNNLDKINEIKETYLVNKFAGNSMKLCPTENNKKAMSYLLSHDDNQEYNDFSKIIENYNHLKGRINYQNYLDVERGLSKLLFVEISLDRNNDNPQRIFESLNSTGLELSQADLIRNYILMGLERQNQENIYVNYWEYIEKFAKDEATNKSKVSDFIRDYLTLENKKIPNKGNVYIEFKLKYPTTSITSLEENLKAIKKFSTFYNKLINPNRENDKDIRLHIEYIHRLDINVTYPFLLKVYDDYNSGDIDKQTFIMVLELIQSYTWRRFIVGLPTNTLNKIFMNLYEKIDISNYLNSLQKSLLLKTGAQRFPKDIEVLDAMKVKDVYNIQSKNRLYFLDRLENYDNKERVNVFKNSDLTIEHIFPQNPNQKWKEELKIEDFNYIRDNYLNTIGNITLSGNNGKLSNKPFLEKRDLTNYGYKESRLWLNKYLSGIQTWDKNAIEQRFKILSDRFLKIWQYPSIELDLVVENGEINIFDADKPTHKKLDYFIFFDQKIKPNSVTELYVYVIKQLFDLQPETFFNSDLSEKLRVTKSSEKNTLNSFGKINEFYVVDTNIDSNSKFDRLKYALEIFDLEDELIIKYSI